MVNSSQREKYCQYLLVEEKSLLTFLFILGWYQGQKRSMKFAVPRIWREPKDHVTDCYFCVVNPRKRRSGKNSKPVEYPDLASSSAPILHSSQFPVPQPPQKSVKLSQSSSHSSYGDVEDKEFVPSQEPPKPHLITTEDFNDLIRDLNLPKSKAELLGSRLKQWNLLLDVNITDQRTRHEIFSTFFTKKDGLCFCHDVKGLFEEIGIPCVPEEWRLFIDSSTKSLKAVLLHNGNKFPSLPVAHSVHFKENYASVKILLEALKYQEYKWQFIGDFKMVGFLMGLQGGYTKYPCYLCLWDSRADAKHYVQRSWPERTEFCVGQSNVKYEPIAVPENVLMPPLHIKLGLMKQFVKALDKNSEAFKFLRNFFPKLSEAKVKAGIFVGPQIKNILKNEEFPKLLTSAQNKGWHSFKEVVSGFLGNNKVENYQEVVENMLENFKAMGCRMSLKVHMLHAHLDKFKNNMGEFSEEQGERFHQDIEDFERRYQGQYNENMMGDYIWGLVRESTDEHARKSYRVHF